MASSMNEQYFGLDLTLKSVKNDIKKKEDILIILVHWSLIKKGFKCIGIGESMNDDENDSPNETLPDDWNLVENYALRYKYNGKIYNLTLNKATDDTVFINLLFQNESLVYSGKFLNMVKDMNVNKIDSIMPEYKEFISNVIEKLISPVDKNQSSTHSTQTETVPLERYSNIRPSASSHWNEPRYGIFHDPRNLGRRDLDPLADPTGGGMLFQPPRRIFPPVSGPFPPGSVPPGARFDPINPGGQDVHPFPRRRYGDEFPPPGYDDMFS